MTSTRRSFFASAAAITGSALLLPSISTAQAGSPVPNPYPHMGELAADANEMFIQAGIAQANLDVNNISILDPVAVGHMSDQVNNFASWAATNNLASQIDSQTLQPITGLNLSACQYLIVQCYSYGMKSQFFDLTPLSELAQFFGPTPASITADYFTNGLTTLASECSSIQQGNWASAYRRSRTEYAVYHPSHPAHLLRVADTGLSATAGVAAAFMAVGAKFVEMAGGVTLLNAIGAATAAELILLAAGAALLLIGFGVGVYVIYRVATMKQPSLGGRWTSPYDNLTDDRSYWEKAAATNPNYPPPTPAPLPFVTSRLLPD